MLSIGSADRSQGSSSLSRARGYPSAPSDLTEPLAELEREAAAAEQEVRVEEIREMERRHVGVALLLLQKGAERLTSMDPEAVTAATAIRAIELGVRFERMARGTDKKIDITQAVREMAIREGIDPDQAVRDAQEVARMMDN